MTLTDQDVEKSMHAAWIAAMHEPPMTRLRLAHLILLQRDRPRSARSRTTPHGLAVETALMEQITAWRDGRDGDDLLARWETAVLAHEHEHWMPRLVGMRSSLPMTPAYAQLTTRPHGPEAMLLLLLLAGETGFRPIIMHWESAAVRMGVEEDTLLHAAALLVAERWVEREPLGGEGEANARVLTLHPTRAPVILAPPAMA